MMSNELVRWETSVLGSGLIKHQTRVGGLCVSVYAGATFVEWQVHTGDVSGFWLVAEGSVPVVRRDIREAVEAAKSDAVAVAASRSEPPACP